MSLQQLEKEKQSGSELREALTKDLEVLQGEKAKTEAAVAEASLKITSLEEASCKVEALGEELAKVQALEREVRVREIRMA